MSDHSPTGAPGDHSDALIRANRKTLTGVLMGDPSTVLSVLTGVVAVCGLLNQVFFYWFFDITYIAYVGASDFLALILKTIPFTLLVVLIALVASGLAALGVIYSQSGVLAWFWRLGIALSLACRLTLSRTCGLLAGVAAWLIRLVRQYQTAWPPERVDRITAIAEAAQALSDLCRDYEPVCQRRAAESCRKRQQVFEKRRHSLRRLRDFANQSYFETFVSMTILMLLMGFVLSGLAGYRLETKLQYPEKQGEFWRPFDPVFAVLFPGFGPEVSVNLDSLRPALNGTVFLGGTSEYGFFLRHPDLTPLVVPTREIELVAIASQVPEGLRKPEEDTEVLIAEQIGRVADSVSSVSNSLDRTSDGLVALGAGLLDRLVVPASLSADCRDNLIKEWTSASPTAISTRWRRRRLPAPRRQSRSTNTTWRWPSTTRCSARGWWTTSRPRRSATGPATTCSWKGTRRARAHSPTTRSWPRRARPRSPATSAPRKFGITWRRSAGRT